MQRWRRILGGNNPVDERLLRLVGIAFVTLVATVALAGCMGLGTGGGGPSLSDAQVGVAESGGPAVAVNYSVDDYATILLEGPENNILNEVEVSPEGNQTAMYMGDVGAGEYELVLRQGDETVDSQTMTFEGAEPQVEIVSPNWSGNTIESVDVTITNTGDLPVYVDNVAYSARGDSVENSVYSWIDANDSRTFNVAGSFGSSVTIEERGDVIGSVEVATDAGVLTDSFQRTFDGPNLTVTNIDTEWENNELHTAEVTVRNDGDLPTTGNVTIVSGGESLASSYSNEVAVGSTTTFELVGYSYIYRAESGGTANLDVIVNSPTGYVTDQITREIAGSNVSIESMNTEWQNGELVSVTFIAANDGEVASDGAAEVTVNGEVVSKDSISIEPSTTSEFTVSDGAYTVEPLYTADSGGSQEVTLSISGDGWSDSETSTTSLGGVDGELSSISTMFFGNYDEDTSDLSSVDFNVRNTGDLTISYDAVEVSIDGVSTTDNLYSATELTPGQSTSEYVSTDLTVDDGSHELTIRLLDDGEEVLSETVTVSTNE
ncbi:hypothetical protein [Halobacterium wangiae]|uniref:hypothetical protein n=1 Tax=Halobacterium wangiae TaxID=2902623 RepID=UPI001E5D62E4|nr:hypothetical protein [Halobacterium wangiae]